MFYFIFHWAIHLLLSFLIIKIFNTNFTYSLFILFATIFPDLDHLKILLKHGVISVIKFNKPMKFFFHNFFFILFSFIGFLIYSKINLCLFFFFLSFFLHLLWDLVEDVVIFKMSIKYWR